jgi:hypothetical protein
MSYLYSKLPETGVPLLIGTGGYGRLRPESASTFPEHAARHQHEACRPVQNLLSRMNDAISKRFQLLEPHGRSLCSAQSDACAHKLRSRSGRSSLIDGLLTAFGFRRIGSPGSKPLYLILPRSIVKSAPQQPLSSCHDLLDHSARTGSFQSRKRPGVYFRGLPRFAKINPRASAVQRSRLAHLSASLRSGPGAIRRASSSASAARLSQSSLSGERGVSLSNA